MYVNVRDRAPRCYESSQLITVHEYVTTGFGRYRPPFLGYEGVTIRYAKVVQLSHLYTLDTRANSVSTSRRIPKFPKAWKHDAPANVVPTASSPIASLCAEHVRGDALEVDIIHRIGADGGVELTE
jgi:hypothetical protein